MLAIIVLALSIYLGFLLNTLRLSRLKVKRQEEKIQNEIKESLRIIALAALQEQCEISEACIRIVGLLKTYPRFHFTSEHADLLSFHAALQDFDYLEARQKLTKQERFTQDQKRFDAEARYMESFKRDAAQILAFAKQ